MKISDLIKHLQSVSDEHGDIIVTFVRPTGGLYLFDVFDTHVCTDESELIFDNLNAIEPLRDFMIEKAFMFGSR